MTETTSTVQGRLDPDLASFRFHEQDWDSYDQLLEAFEWEIPDQFNTATYVCDRWADHDPARVAVAVVGADDADTEVTFGQVQSYANQVANALAERGVQRGDRIAVSGSQRVECLAAHIAAWKLGAVSVPLSIRFGPEGLGYRLADSGAVAFVADAESLPALREIRDDCESVETVLVASGNAKTDELGFHDAVDSQSTALETYETDASAPATIMYTSGTTGSPKGVVRSHGSLLGVLPSHLLSIRNLDLQQDDLLYSPAEWSWMGPLHQGILPALFYGTPVLADASPGFDPERVFDLINRYGVTMLGGATTVYRFMMQVPGADERYDLSSLRVVLGAGEPLGQTLVEWWRELVPGVAVHEAYGQTEAGVFVGDCEALDVVHQPGRMGRPYPGCAVRVVEPETRERVAQGEVGEIELRYDGNSGCFTEYWNEPEKTAKKVQDGWLRTEDLGATAEDGSLSFHSRADDVITSSGYRIGPAEIEESLAGHEAVAQAGVIGVPDDTRGEVPKAFVVLTPGTEPSADLRAELQAYVKDRLAKHEYPRELVFVEALPLTSTGKVRRHDLRERAPRGANGSKRNER